MKDKRLVYQVKMVKGSRRVHRVRRRDDRRGREGQEVRRPQGRGRERRRRATKLVRREEGSTADEGLRQEALTHRPRRLRRAPHQGVSGSARSGSPGRAFFLLSLASALRASTLRALPLVLSLVLAQRSPRSRSGSPIGSPCPTRRRTSTRSRSTWTACAARRCRCSCPSGRPAATRRWTSRGTSRSSARPTPTAGRCAGTRRTARAGSCRPAARATVRLRYRVFANAALGHVQRARYRARQLERRVALHVRRGPQARSGHARRRRRPPGWHIINGDTRTADQTRLPIRELRPAHRHAHRGRARRCCSTRSSSTDSRYRTMVHHNGPAPAAARERFVRDVEKIVRYENSVFAPPPLEQYTFLFNIGYPGGDGMEHLYSTQIINRAPVGRLGRGAARHHDRGARVLPRLEREARASRRARAVRLHARAVSAEPLGRRRLDAVLRPDARSGAPASSTATRSTRRWRG